MLKVINNFFSVLQNTKRLMLWHQNSIHLEFVLSGKYCGTEVPHPVTSFSNGLVVNFVSDSSVSKKGFRATYAASTSSRRSYLIWNVFWVHQRPNKSKILFFYVLSLFFSSLLFSSLLFSLVYLNLYLRLWWKLLYGVWRLQQSQLPRRLSPQHRVCVANLQLAWQPSADVFHVSFLHSSHHAVPTAQ